MNKRIIGSLIAMLFLGTLTEVVTVFATSYPPAPLYHKEGTGKTVSMVGQTVHLFHSGTDDVKQHIHPNDILTVYRINPSCEAKTVGKIKALSYIGETYLKGVVIEGEIKPNDIAKKGNVSCLVISAGLCKE